MKLTKLKLKQLIKEEIEAVREEYFGADAENIFEPSTYEGMFDPEVVDTFEDSLREFVGNYLDEEELMTLEDNEIKKLETAVMTALKGAKANSRARRTVKTALENVVAAIRTGDLR